MKFNRANPVRVKCPECGTIIRKPMPTQPQKCIACGAPIPEDLESCDHFEMPTGAPSIPSE